MWRSRQCIGKTGGTGPSVETSSGQRPSGRNSCKNGSGRAEHFAQRLVQSAGREALDGYTLENLTAAPGSAHLLAQGAHEIDHLRADGFIRYRAIGGQYLFGFLARQAFRVGAGAGVGTGGVMVRRAFEKV